MVTEALKWLLHSYGLLDITIHGLAKERPGAKFKSYEEYFASLPPTEKDEPVILVRLSNDPEFDIQAAAEVGLEFRTPAGEDMTAVKVMDMPADEFYYFKAFRQGLFDLQVQLPNFLYAMGLMHGYGLFENYLSQILKTRLLAHPKLLGAAKQTTYAEIFESSSKEDLIGRLVDREIREILYLPIQGILGEMRKRFGFKKLTTKYDQEMRRIALVRNAVAHNGSQVSPMLAKEFPDKYSEGHLLTIDDKELSSAIRVLRKLCWEIDQCLPVSSTQPG